MGRSGGGPDGARAGSPDPASVELARRTLDVLRSRLAAAGAPRTRLELAEAAVRSLLVRALRRLPGVGAFVVTGDIPALWLRDSAAQVRPLLLLAGEVPELADLVAGVLRTQVELLLVDPRANAFNPGPTGAAMRRDFPDQSPWVYERKWALDSPCWPLALGWTLWRTTGGTGHVDERFVAAAASVLALMRREQEHEPGAYRLWRPLRPRRDSPSRRGRGAPVAPAGLIWSAYRPSDDACRYGFHVPANALAAVTLERLAELLGAAGGAHAEAPALAADARALAAEVRAALALHAVVPGPQGEPVLAYEIDGLGGVLLGDDANVPSLVSLPYVGFCSATDALYRSTRAFALSSANPWWSEGRAARGVGSPHTPRSYVWPLAIAVEGLTGTAVACEEALQRIELLVGKRRAIPESVHRDRPARFTRIWFSWAEMAYVELALAAAGERLPGTR